MNIWWYKSTDQENNRKNQLMVWQWKKIKKLERNRYARWYDKRISHSYKLKERLCTELSQNISSNLKKKTSRNTAIEWKTHLILRTLDRMKMYWEGTNVTNSDSRFSEQKSEQGEAKPVFARSARKDRREWLTAKFSSVSEKLEKHRSRSKMR